MFRSLIVSLFMVSLITVTSEGQGPEGGEFVFQRVTQGMLRQELVERGELQAARQTDVVCQLHGEDGTGRAGTILWLIEDGVTVKKGELLARIDDSRIKESLQTQSLLCKQKSAALSEAMEEVEIVKSRVAVDVRTAELTVKLIELDLAEAKDEQTKVRMAIKKQIAELGYEHAKREAALRLKQASARLEPLKQSVQTASETLRELEGQIALCQITAPHDGLLTYFITESSRFGSNAAIAVGEPVKAGQKLFTIPDLSRFQVVCKVHESMVNRLKLGMKANVALPGGTSTTTVSSIATLASTSDWMSSDVKVYTVRLSLADGEVSDSLKPGMSAQVTIQLAERANAILVPVQAVRDERVQRYCYVKSGQGVERRMLKTGISNGQSMEVLQGLKAGEEVVMNPPRRSDPKEVRRPVVPDPKPQNVLQLRSIRVSEGSGRRSFVERYGLTHDDMSFLRSLSPSMLAPVRQSGMEVRDKTDSRTMTVPVLGTTATFASFHPSLVAGIDGRFLCDADNSDLCRVAVIGKAVADKLFPHCDPLGETIRMVGKNRLWTVVGVLSGQHGELERMNEAVIVPYAAEQAHHGETRVIRASGMRGAEAVAYSHILLQPEAGMSLSQAASIIRSRLEATHPTQDWGLSGARDEANTHR